MSIFKKVYNVFYGLYLEYLIWQDNRSYKTKKITPKEIAQVIRQYSQTYEGVRVMKRNLREFLSKDKTHNEKVLEFTEDLVGFGEKEKDHPQVRAINYLKSKMDLSNTDIKTDVDRAKMIEKRIADYKELHEHIAKRKALREARKNNGKPN